MQSHTQQEMEHYDRLARDWRESGANRKWDSDAEYLQHGIFASYQFCDDWMQRHIKKDMKVLDFGCGNGIHSVLPTKKGAQLVGIDISKESLAIARERMKHEGVQKRGTFLQMDCEALTFNNDTFDIVFDGGTFSSLDIIKAIPELARVLKPQGSLLSIETLGHNPFTNAKRALNKLLGRRTGWAVDHIFKINDLPLLKEYFHTVETRYFHLLSLVVFPFLRIPGSHVVLRFLERIDAWLLRIPLLQRYAFKIVIIASQPKH